DNGGLRESFRAFQTYVKTYGEPLRLPYVSQYTPQQLYFLSYASMWCNNIRPEELRKQIEMSSTTPYKYRVNIALSNFQSFSDVFKCGPHSPMNMTDKCVFGDKIYIKPNICTTPECESAGKALQDNINEFADPCDDFYRYACGGWEVRHEMPADKNWLTAYHILDDKLQLIIRELLSQNRSTKTRNARGMTPLIEALKSVGGWPIMGQSGGYNDSEFDWKDAFVKHVIKSESSPVFALSVLADANDTLVNRFYFSRSTFGLSRSQLLNRDDYPDIFRAYNKFILQSAILLGAKNNRQIHRDIDSMIDFEIKLAQLSLPPEDSEDPNVWYNRISFEEFNQLTHNRVDWLNITNSLMTELNETIRMKSDDLVIIQDINYFINVTQLLTTTPKRVIANYFGWDFARSMGSHTDKRFRDIAFQFIRVISEVERDVELWQSCIRSVSESLPYAVSRLYVGKHFTPNDKQMAQNLIHDIKLAYNELIVENQWLDVKTKAKSIIKLNAITDNVGYPDWILNNTDLDNYYELVANDTDRGKRRLRFHIQLHHKRPAALNYGAIGRIIGHEYTHGFDTRGSEFDSKGNFRNWFTEEAKKTFDEKSNCFVKQYSSEYVSETDMNLNGRNTLGENIADNGGLRESFRAFQTKARKVCMQFCIGEPQRLPYVSQYTPQQLYFLSYASVWCNIIRPNKLGRQIEFFSHSPNKYRVNVPLSNFQPFSDAFQCGPHSPMSRKDKCIVW
ncbi:unnamed protein product, partial [Oppiella nova]